MRTFLLALLLVGCVDTDPSVPPQPPEVYCPAQGSRCGCSGFDKAECDSECCQWFVGAGCDCRPQRDAR